MSQPGAILGDLLAPVVAGFGAELEGVTVSRAGSRSVVRVIVDRDGGLDLDTVADVSQAVSAALDTAPEADRVLRGAFVLEVTTPGVDRPLTEPRHWRRATGRLVKISRRAGGSITARIVNAGSDSVELADPQSGARSTVAYADVSRAVVQVEFAPAGERDAS